MVNNALAVFLLTRPLRGVTIIRINCYHFLPIFLLTRPLRGVTSLPVCSSICRLFLLTRPLRGVTNFRLCYVPIEGISTHTPLARRDWLQSVQRWY